MKKEIRELIIQKLSHKLDLFGLKASEINDDFDLVQSGLLDSMAFVELIADIEKKLGKEIDFEEAFENPEFTSIKGINLVFNN